MEDKCKQREPSQVTGELGQLAEALGQLETTAEHLEERLLNVSHLAPPTEVVESAPTAIELVALAEEIHASCRRITRVSDRLISLLGRLEN